jgi:hypothetical protein
MRARDTEEEILSILYDFGPLKDRSFPRIKVTFQIFENIRSSHWYYDSDNAVIEIVQTYLNMQELSLS